MDEVKNDKRNTVRDNDFSAPRMEISTNISCSVNCSYCPQKTIIKAYYGRSSQNYLELDTFKKCIKKIPKERIIVFAGFSEPWLNPNCTRMVAITNDRGHKIRINTTLVGMKVEDILSLKMMKFERFNVHLPSHENEKLENITVDDDYLKKLELLLNIGIPIDAHYHGNALHSEVAQVIGSFAVRKKLNNRAGNVTGKFGQLREPLEGKIKCRRGLHANMMLPNGDVVICCMDFGLNHILGNLTSIKYEELFETKSFKQIKKGMRDNTVQVLCRFCHLAYQQIP